MIARCVGLWAKRVVIVLGALSIGAAAPDPEIEAKTKAFLERPEQIDAVRSALIGQAASLPRACARLTFRPVALLLAMPPTPRFDEAGTMVEGSVRERFAGGGCGTFAPLFNVWMIATPGQTTRIFAGNPGTTGATVDVQQQATPTATVAAGRVLGGCGSLNVIDTKEIGYDTPPGEGPGAWREVWLVGGCGMFAQVLLHFIPDPEGRVQIEVPPEGVRRVNLR